VSHSVQSRLYVILPNCKPERLGTGPRYPIPTTSPPPACPSDPHLRDAGAGAAALSGTALVIVEGGGPLGYLGGGDSRLLGGCERV
jgi:hypothetical protein